MAEQFFVAEAPGSGLVGLLAEPEIRRRLTAGSLRPTFVCLPASATGEVAGQWRPLADVFGTHPSDAPSIDRLPGPRRGRRLSRLWGDAALLAAGTVFVVVGVIVRVQARAWAWPDEWSYSGNRANTPWAYNEALYIDLGLAALAFGIGLILLGVWRAVR